MKSVDALKYEIFPQHFQKYPISWEEVFDGTGPLGVEIGCGNGEFLVNWANAQPDWNFLGIELSLTSIERMQKRIYQSQLSNVRVILDDARFAARELFSEGSINRVIMNFPDPWPKEKHRQHRVINEEFISTLANVLIFKGEFELVTDEKWYAADAFSLFKNSNYFELSDIDKNPERPVKTKYERKWMEHRKDIWLVRAKKRENTTVKRIVEDGEMPHVILKNEPRSDEIHKLTGMVKKSSDHVFVVKEVFIQPEKSSYLLRLVSKDQDYTQRFFILISPHPKGFIIKIDPNLQPYRTPAVKYAVYEIGRMLQN